MHAEVQDMLNNEQRVYDRLNGRGLSIWEAVDEEETDAPEKLARLWQHALHCGDYGKEYTNEQFSQFVRCWLRRQGISI